MSLLGIEKGNNTSPKCYRGGVIPYTLIDNTLHFCFGVDRKYQQYTDFAGGIKKHETIIVGSLREFDEETNSVFGKLVEKDLHNTVYLCNKRTFVYFYPIPNANIIKTSVEDFKKTFNHEISDIKWMSFNELSRILTNHEDRSMYKVTKKCLLELDDIDEFIGLLSSRINN